MEVRLIRSEINQLMPTDTLPVFAWEEYLSTMSSEYGWFVADTMVLPFYQTKRIGVRRIFCTTGVIGQTPVSVEKEREFLNEVVRVARRAKIDIIDEPYTNAIFQTVPDGAIYAKYGTYIVMLDKTREELLQGVHTKFRSRVKRAAIDGLEVKCGKEYLEMAADLIKETYNRQGKEHDSKNELVVLNEKLGDHLAVYVVFNKGHLDSVAVVPWSHHSAVYYHGGNGNDIHPGASKYLQYSIMCDMHDRQVALYDFMGARIDPEPGSKYEKLQEFKSRMGSTLVVGYRWLYPLSPVKFYLFRMALFLKSLLKGKIYRDTGIFYERKRQRRRAKRGS